MANVVSSGKLCLGNHVKKDLIIKIGYCLLLIDGSIITRGEEAEDANEESISVKDSVKNLHFFSQ